MNSLDLPIRAKGNWQMQGSLHLALASAIQYPLASFNSRQMDATGIEAFLGNPTGVGGPLRDLIHLF